MYVIPLINTRIFVETFRKEQRATKLRERQKLQLCQKRFEGCKKVSYHRQCNK